MKKLNYYCRRALYSFGSAIIAACATPQQDLGRMVETLITPTYYVSIRSLKDWDSKNVRFVVQDRKTRATRIFDGQKEFVTCESKHEGPDCDALDGYSFNDGKDHYFITDTGRLTVRREGHTVFWERGIWQEGNAAGQ